MDVVITLINHNGNKTCFGADHFGYEDLYLKAVKILTTADLNKSDMNFIGVNLYRVDDDEYASSDVIIDDMNKVICLCSGFNIKEVSGDVSHLPHVIFDRVDLLLNEQMSYDEFHHLYEFFLSVIEYDDVVINDKYIYHIDKSFH